MYDRILDGPSAPKDKIMHQSNLAEYLEHNELDEPEERNELHTRFPHAVLIEGDFPEVGVAIRWCWSNFGPIHGECWNWEYPACPLVLKTEKIKLCEINGWQWEKKVYGTVADHCHLGNWALNWLGKTDYDHGFGEFCFTNLSQREAFVNQLPKFDWGENYPWLRERET